MKLSTALSVLPFLAGASAVPTAQKPAPFDVMAVSEGDLQYHALAASSSFFYIGGKSETSSSCPIDVQKKGGCPPGDTTVFKNANFLVIPSPVSHKPTHLLTVIVFLGLSCRQPACLRRPQRQRQTNRHRRSWHGTRCQN